MVAAHPGRAARGFPAVPIAENARLYARVSTLTAISAFVACNAWLFWKRPLSIPPILLGFVFPAVFAYEICESLLAEGLANVSRPRHVRESIGHWHWKALLQYTGGFKPLFIMSACAALNALAAPRTSRIAQIQLIAAIAACAAILGWWAASVFIMARQWGSGVVFVAKTAACVIASILTAGFVYGSLAFLFGAFGFFITYLMR